MRTISRLLVAACLLLPAAANAVAPPWIAAGASGSINPGNEWYTFSPGNPSVGIAPFFATGTILVWNQGGITFSSSYTGTGTFSVTYNVTSPQASPGWNAFEIGYSGISGSGPYVAATLYEVDPHTGNRTSLCNVGSPVGSTYQGCDLTTAMTFNNTKAYYVQVDLTRTAKTQFPQINYISIH